MQTIKTLIAAAAVAMVAVLGFAYSGTYDISADAPHSGFTKWLFSTTKHASVKRQASNIEVPDLSDEALILAGVNDFKGMCAECHGAPGQAAKAMAQGMNPAPPDLAEEVLELSAAELFWVTKHGIKMTGMPAWGVTHDDDTIWPVIAFITTLPELDATQYQEMLTRAGSLGHHADAAAHPDEAPQEPDQHDHSRHEH
ncbi:MAG: cytochrome c [Proteobacteria bacterium]|nr:cytochrome c [Pseudomonadota bacterium]